MQQILPSENALSIKLDRLAKDEASNMFGRNSGFVTPIIEELNSSIFNTHPCIIHQKNDSPKYLRFANAMCCTLWDSF